jgi:hypothetical protein
MEINLKNLIKESLSVLLEGRLEDVKAKYSEIEGSAGAIDQLSQGDPSGNNKYLEWMAKISFTDETSEFRVEDLISVVTAYHQGLPRVNSQFSTPIVDENKAMFPGRAERRVKNNPKDINSYPTFNSLKLITDALEETKKERPDRDRIYQDDKWTIIVPKSHDAACKYGVHSNWCVSTSNPTYFKRYTEDRKALLFFIIWRNKRNESDKTEYKIAINAKYKDWENPKEWDWYDMPDHTMDPNLMLNIFPPKMVEVVQRYLVKEGKAKGLIVDKAKLGELITNNSTTTLGTSEDGTYFLTNNIEAFRGLEDYEYTTRWSNVQDINNGVYRVFVSNQGRIEVSSVEWRSDQSNEALIDDFKSWTKYYKRDRDFFRYIHQMNSDVTPNQEAKENFNARVRGILSEAGGMWVETRTTDLNVGDRVRFKKGRGYWDQQRNPWNTTTIDRQTPSGFFVTGKTDQYPKGRRFKPSYNASMDVWHSFEGDINLEASNN